MMATCHSSRCRKEVAITFIFVRAETFLWVCGPELIQRYEATPPYKYYRGICARSGTALGEPGGGVSFPINANCLDDDPKIRVRFHEFVADMPAWYAICDNAVQFDGYPTRAPQRSRHVQGAGP